MRMMKCWRMRVKRSQIECPKHDRFVDDGEGAVLCETCKCEAKDAVGTYVAVSCPPELDEVVYLNPNHVRKIVEGQVRTNCLDLDVDGFEVRLEGDLSDGPFRGTVEVGAEEWGRAMNDGIPSKWKLPGGAGVVTG